MSVADLLERRVGVGLAVEKERLRAAVLEQRAAPVELHSREERERQLLLTGNLPSRGPI